MVRLTDLIFLSVPLPYHFILKMLLAVEFDRKNGQLAFSPLFIDNKVESSHIKQIIISDIIMEHLGYGNLFVDRIFIPGEPDIFQRMCQVFHKCRFCFRGKRLDSKCSRTDMFFRNF